MAFDFTKKIDTSGAVRHTSPGDVEAARLQATGTPAPPYDPAEHARLGRILENRIQRTVMGLYENKGRSPMHVLTPTQFAQFIETGGWEGMPSPEEYGPHSAVREDKAYE